MEILTPYILYSNMQSEHFPMFAFSLCIHDLLHHLRATCRCLNSRSLVGQLLLPWSLSIPWRLPQNQLLQDLSSKARERPCAGGKDPLPLQEPEIHSLQALETLQTLYYDRLPYVQGRCTLGLQEHG